MKTILTEYLFRLHGYSVEVVTSVPTNPLINPKSFIFKKDFDKKHEILDRFIQVKYADEIYELSFEVKGQWKTFPTKEIRYLEDLNSAIDNFIDEYKKTNKDECN